LTRQAIFQKSRAPHPEAGYAAMPKAVAFRRRAGPMKASLSFAGQEAQPRRGAPFPLWARRNVKTAQYDSRPESFAEPQKRYSSLSQMPSVFVPFWPPRCPLQIKNAADTSRAAAPSKLPPQSRGWPSPLFFQFLRHKRTICGSSTKNQALISRCPLQEMAGMLSRSAPPPSFSGEA
jgi:hypothetical protein